MGSAEIGPLTLGEILDRMFSIYRRHFLLLVGIAGIPYAFLIVLGGLIGGIFALTNRNAPGVARMGIVPSAGAIAAVIIVIALIFILGAILASIATYAAVWDIQVGRKPGIRRAYRLAWGHLGAAILAGILSFLAIGAGLFLLIIPGIIVWLALSLVYAVIVAEDSGGFSALNRSWELTKGYRWKVFVASLVYLAVSTAITYGIQLPVILASAFVFPQNTAPIWFTILSALASVLGGVLPAPLLAIASCVIYYDARVRKEGFDLQRLLDELPPASAAATPGIAVN